MHAPFRVLLSTRATCVLGAALVLVSGALPGMSLQCLAGAVGQRTEPYGRKASTVATSQLKGTAEDAQPCSSSAEVERCMSRLITHSAIQALHVRVDGTGPPISLHHAHGHGREPPKAYGNAHYRTYRITCTPHVSGTWL